MKLPLMSLDQRNAVKLFRYDIFQFIERCDIIGALDDRIHTSHRPILSEEIRIYS